ncbi:MAG: Clp protease N-terminal domain-containing protein [Hyphomicrobiaceae bacterium]
MAQSLNDLVDSFKPNATFVETLHRANGYAQAQRHVVLQIEHVLLALIEDPEAQPVLQACSVDLDVLATEVSGFLGRLDDRMPGTVPYEPRTHEDLVRILRVASAAASQRRRAPNGGLVLAAIVGDGRSPSANMLRVQGLTFEQAVKALSQATAAAAAAPDAQSASPRSGLEEDQSRGPPVADTPPRTVPPPAPRSPQGLASPAPAPADPLTQGLRPFGGPDGHAREPSRPLPEQQARAALETGSLPGGGEQSTAEGLAPSRGQPAPHGATADAPLGQPRTKQPGLLAAEAPESGIRQQAARPTNMREILDDARRRVEATRPAVRSGPSDDRDGLARLQITRPRRSDGAPQAGQPGAMAPRTRHRAPTDAPATTGPVARPHDPNPQAPGTALPPLGGARTPTSQAQPVDAIAAMPGVPPGAGPTGRPGPIGPGTDPRAGQAAGPVLQANPHDVSLASGQAARKAPNLPLPQSTTADPRARQQPAFSAEAAVTVPPQAAPGPTAGRRPSVAPTAPPEAPGLRGRPPTAPPTTTPPIQAAAPKQAGLSMPQRDQRELTAPGPFPAAEQQQNSRRSGAPLAQPDAIPRRMRVGETEVVEVRVSRHDIAAMGGPGTQPGRREFVVTKALTLKLRSPGGAISVEPRVLETQWIEHRLGLLSDDDVVWRWDISPLTQGREQLQLSGSLRCVTSDGFATEIAVPEERFDVTIQRPRGRIARNVAIALLLLLAGGALGFVARNALVVFAG